MSRKPALFSILALAAATLSGCMTAHFANARMTANGQLEISCGKSSNMSTGMYVTATCTLENHTDAWMKLQVHEIHPLTPRARILSAQEIGVFHQALQLQRTQEAHNKAVLLAGLAVIGSVAEAASDDPVIKAAGASAVAAAELTAVADAVAEDQDRADHGDWQYGPEHIAGGVIDIPAGMFIRRQFVLEMPKSHQPPVVRICFETHGCVNAVLE